MTQTKNHHILCTGMQITCTDGQCHKNYQWMVLSGLKTPTFNENFINIYNGDSDVGYFLKLMLNILNNYTKYAVIYYFY